MGWEGFFSTGLILLVGAVVLGFILTRLYQKAPKGLALVITGGFRSKKDAQGNKRGSEKVVINGGTVFIPLYQTLTKVNLKSIKISIERQALNTKDRLLIDLKVDFSMRCKTDDASIALAAEKLGDRTMKVETLREFLESRFEGAIRAVAQSMEHDELFENRKKFNGEVLNATQEGLGKVGFELESVDLINVKQTPINQYTDDNVLNAEGKAKVVKRISEKKKETNDIERATEVDIQRKNMETTREKLELEREAEYARLEQEKELSNRKAQQQAEIVTSQAAREKEAEEKRIEAEEVKAKAKIEADERVKQKQIEEEQITKKAEIEKDKILEQAQIEKDRLTKVAEVNRQKELEVTEQAKLVALTEATKEREQAEVNKLKSIELAEQDRAIEVAAKSKETSEAEAAADQARAKAIGEQEKVITVQEVAIAEREKQIKLTKAAQVAEEQAIGTKVLAQSEKDAAEDHAEAVRIRAKAEAEKVTIEAEAREAQGKADASVILNKAEAEAEGKRKLHDAENALSEAQIKLRRDLAFIEALPEMFEGLNKPLEKVKDIRLLSADGFGRSGGTMVNKDGKKVPVNSTENPGVVNQYLDALLQFQFQKPFFQEITKHFDFPGGLEPDELMKFAVGKSENVKPNGPLKRPNGPLSQ